MEKQNIIPRRLEKYNIPTFSACLFAKATLPQCKNKQQNHWSEEKTATKPGYLIYIDQMVSPTPGFIGQIAGILTRNRYNYATVFVDQYSGLGYLYLQRNG